MQVNTMKNVNILQKDPWEAIDDMWNDTTFNPESTTYFSLHSKYKKKPIWATMK